MYITIIIPITIPYIILYIPIIVFLHIPVYHCMAVSSLFVVMKIEVARPGESDRFL